MKKLVPMIAFLIVAVGLGLWLGLRLFGHQANQERATSQHDYSTVEIATPAQIKKREEGQRQKALPKKTQNQLRKLNNMLEEEILPLDQQCAEEFKNEFPSNDFLDPNSDVFAQPQDIERGIMLVNSALDTINVKVDFDYLAEQLTQNDDVDPLELRTLMQKSVVCNEVRFTNFLLSLVRAIGRNQKITLKQKAKDTIQLMDAAERYVYKDASTEYTFVGMEMVFSLLDNELISRDHKAELDLIRQDLIHLVQDFESEFSSQNSKAINQDLLRQYRQSIADINESIRLLIERIRSEIPN